MPQILHAIVPHDRSELWLGMLVIFSVVFCFALFWQVILYLEDPTESEWLRERVPEEWLTVDVDEALGLDKVREANGVAVAYEGGVGDI